MTELVSVQRARAMRHLAAQMLMAARKHDQMAILWQHDGTRILVPHSETEQARAHRIAAMHTTQAHACRAIAHEAKTTGDLDATCLRFHTAYCATDLDVYRYAYRAVDGVRRLS